uniref:Solute carrier family 26 member 11 n=1 Tax=Callorhinchus milii TaxID=7868 RepID=A0A4W3JZG1_CALMI
MCLVPRALGHAWSRALRKCCSYGTFRAVFPILGWLPRYSSHWLRMDLLAGVTVGLTVVPQALAYAEIAGLPVQYGLYSSFMGSFVYCLLGTSKDITLGPTAIMSLLVSIYAFHDPAYAVLLAFLSGCVQLAMGILRLGFLVDFISLPVIKGFTSSAALTIGFGQVKNILGLRDIPRQFFLEVYYTFHNIMETRVGDLVLGVSCILLLVLLKMMKGHCFTEKVFLVLFAARNAVVVVAAGIVAYSFENQGLHVFVLTGKTDRGLPPFRPPPFSKVSPNGTVHFDKMVWDMGAGLAVVPLVGFLESIAIAKAFASQNNYRIDPNQELIAIGSTNILGSFVSSYPVTGSFGRTAVNSQTGVCSPAGGIITGTIVLLSLAFLTPLFYYVPKAALAAVIICAVLPVFDGGIIAKLWKVKKLDLLPFFASFLAMEPFWEYRGILILFLFLSTASAPRSVILDCVHVSSIDYTAVNLLRELISEFQEKAVPLLFSNLRVCNHSNLMADIKGLRYFDDTETALHVSGDETHSSLTFLVSRYVLPLTSPSGSSLRSRTSLWRSC